MTDKMKHNLLTRKEIIKLWEKQKKEILNSYCCPSCRSVLFKYNSDSIYSSDAKEYYYCHYNDCKHYNIPIERLN